MKNYELFVGIDVSKLKLDISLIQPSDPNDSKHFVIANTVKGLQELLNRLKKFKID